MRRRIVGRRYQWIAIVKVIDQVSGESGQRHRVTAIVVHDQLGAAADVCEVNGRQLQSNTVGVIGHPSRLDWIGQGSDRHITRQWNGFDGQAG